MGYLQEQHIVYVDRDEIKNNLLDNSTENLKFCPDQDMRKDHAKSFDISGANKGDPDITINERLFKFTDIQSLIHDACGNINSVENFNEIPNCPTDLNFSGCCKKETLDNGGNMLDNCNKNHSTGLLYEHDSKKYNICHSEEIQNYKGYFEVITDQEPGLDKFFKILLFSIIALVLVTFLSLPYEFWLRYGNSIRCIYYKVADNCKNRGSKKSTNDGKLTIIEYIFPDNLNNYPYEACSNKSSNQIGGNEKPGKINSNYIEYYDDNGSKCINVDFEDDVDDIGKKPFPYNIGQYANDKTKVKNNFLAMILKGFSFYFLFTILIIRKILNYTLSGASKLYQKKIEKYSWISKALLLLSIIFTPFTILTTIISIILGITLFIFPLITISDFLKSIKIFKEDIETSPSTQDNPNYYKIFDVKNIFYNAHPEGYIPRENDNVMFCTLIGVFIASIILLVIRLNTTRGENIFHIVATFILFTVLPGIGYIFSKYKTLPKGTIKFLDFVKRNILNVFLLIPILATFIITLIIGAFSSLLAIFYGIFSILFNFYYIPYSNNIEFLDLFKSHSKLLTILLLISVITSSALGLSLNTTGMLGGLLALYLLYELYKVTK